MALSLEFISWPILLVTSCGMGPSLIGVALLVTGLSLELDTDTNVFRLLTEAFALFSIAVGTRGKVQVAVLSRICFSRAEIRAATDSGAVPLSAAMTIFFFNANRYHSKFEYQTGCDWKWNRRPPLPFFCSFLDVGIVQSLSIKRLSATTSSFFHVGTIMFEYQTGCD